MEVNGSPKQPGYKLSSKYLPLCSAEQRHSYRVGTTGGWVNDDRIYIFGWTNPFKAGLTLRFFKRPLGLYLSDCTNMMIISHCWISVVINVRLRDQSFGHHEKYMNGGNTGIFKKNSVCSSAHPHENSSATSVYIEKATYQMNSVSAGVYGW